MTHLAQTERAHLCDTLLTRGPDAPTLCSPWRTAELAAHLVIRERRPDLAPGIWVPFLAGRTEAAMQRYAARPWPELVDLVRSPPPFSPTRLPQLDDVVNLVEFFVHHEDVLRAESPGPKRAYEDALQAALWVSLKRVGRVHFRRARTGVVLESDRGRTVTVKGPTGLGTVIVRGTPAELVLASHGRVRVADVEAQGGDAAVEALWASPLGL